MSTKVALDSARKARKAAPPNMYDFVRCLERAIEELAKEIENLRSRGPKRGVRSPKASAPQAANADGAAPDDNET